MNAYELADKLTALEMADELEKGPLIPRDSAAKMIRQQADRIAELQEINNRFADLIQSLREEVDKLRKESE